MSESGEYEWDIFSVEKDQFDGREDFHRSLVESDISLEGLHIVGGITDVSIGQFEETLIAHGWTLGEKLGEVYRIRHKNNSYDDTECYLTIDPENQDFLIYNTQNKTEQIDNTIYDDLFSESGHLHYLYLPPSVMMGFRENLYDEYGEDMSIPQFVSRSSTDTHTYHGEDGINHSRHLEKKYDVSPANIVFNINDKIKFKVTNKGLFKLISGSLKTLFDLMENCISETRNIKVAYEESEYTVAKLETSHTLPAATPVNINTTNASSEANEELKSGIMDIDRYTLTDPYSSPSGRYFSSTVYDGKNNRSFDIKATPEHIQFLPHKDENISTFYSFLQLVQERVDNQAEVGDLDD